MKLEFIDVVRGTYNHSDAFATFEVSGEGFEKISRFVLRDHLNQYALPLLKSQFNAHGYQVMDFSFEDQGFGLTLFIRSNKQELNKKDLNNLLDKLKTCDLTWNVKKAYASSSSSRFYQPASEADASDQNEQVLHI